MILHHYESSPYAEKIRLMLGYTGLPWASVLSPEQPPRPNLDPLTGGYRRIPVAQIGADIFCDTFVIAQEIAALANAPELDPERAPAGAAEVMRAAEGDVFFAAIGSVPPLTLLGTMLRQLGVLGTLRLSLDRARMMREATVNPPRGASARRVMQGFLEDLESRLAGREYLGAAGPSIADFCAYHPLWLHLRCTRGSVDGRFPRVARWYERMTAIGHGARRESTPQEAWEAARAADPRPLPAVAGEPDPRIGKQVAVAPTDYGTQAVTGTLVAVTGSRCVIARESERFGTLHVHFPLRGYAIEVV